MKDIGNLNYTALGLVAGGCLVTLLVGSVFMMRWRAVGDETHELSDAEKGSGTKFEAEPLPTSRSKSKRGSLERRGTVGSQTSSAGGSARPL